MKEIAFMGFCTCKICGNQTCLGTYQYWIDRIVSEGKNGKLMVESYNGIFQPTGFRLEAWISALRYVETHPIWNSILIRHLSMIAYGCANATKESLWK